MNTSDEWIRQRSGIVERRHVEPGRRQLRPGGRSGAAWPWRTPGPSPRTSTSSSPPRSRPTTISPATASSSRPSSAWGPSAPWTSATSAADSSTPCPSADQYIRTGTYKKILLVASEVQSTNLDYSDDGRDMAVLFGDGAGAVILEPEAERRRPGRPLHPSLLRRPLRLRPLDGEAELPGQPDVPGERFRREEVLSPHGRQERLQERLPADAGGRPGRRSRTTA